jgi:metal-responsive CopG/Arc/MetJ family transcriptional regulator
MATKQNRIMITLSDENLSRLEAVYDKFGVSKSAQIQSLIAKYLEAEFGKIEQKGVVHEGK